MWVAIGVVAGVGSWLDGASLLYRFLDLIDALRPPPDGRPDRATWGLLLLLVVGLAPLVAVLGAAHVLTVLLRWGATSQPRPS
jgi:hypothetical protein